MNRSVWFVVAPALVLAACGQEDAPNAGATSSPSDDQVYTGTFFVLESPDHGPQLCVEVLESNPPQCSGTDMAGWSWADVEDKESVGGTTYGTYVVTGTYDGTVFTVTEPGVPATDTPILPQPSNDFSTPCDPPAGGWSVVEPAKATEEAMWAASEQAAAETAYGTSWMDQSINPDGSTNDLIRAVLNFTFTGDLERREAGLREIWGGALCVSQAERTQTELTAIERDLAALPERIDHHIDEIAGTFKLYVMLEDDDLQARLDEKHGEGTIRLVGLLQPVDR